ncbi:hypothetical protein FSC37_11310 [Piscinibacter aquaticus]|uniref:Uncharacterized protein n=1 Tax=Piscinibacter aquaticus TaxID=392597 RepID=A0A5C6U002_9BURK|nr:hypothetical protein FSC37_11310 [Piscinibacter aquaticus]
MEKQTSSSECRSSGTGSCRGSQGSPRGGARRTRSRSRRAPASRSRARSRRCRCRPRRRCGRAGGRTSPCSAARAPRRCRRTPRRRSACSRSCRRRRG